MRRALIVAAALALGVAAVRAASVPVVGFKATTQLVGEKGATLAAIFDATGDGKADVVLAPTYYQGVRVYPGRGDGTFDAVSTVSTNRKSVQSLTHARLNADGVDDIVLCEKGTTWMEVLLSDGAGGYTSRTYVAQGAVQGESHAAALLDWDGDGDVDVFAAGTVNAHRVLLNDGAGGFSAPAAVPSVSPSFRAIVAQPVAADLDGDGDIDVAVATLTRIDVFLRQADGSFAAGPAIAASALPGTLVSADFDGDGLADLACLERVQPLPTLQVAVLLHTAPTSFGGKALFSSLDQFEVNGIAAADLNGDGRAEIVTPRSVLVNAGDGTFPKARMLPAMVVLSAATGAFSAAAGDVDGDGTPDLVTIPSWWDTSPFAASVLLSGAPVSYPYVFHTSPPTLFRGTSGSLSITGRNFDPLLAAEFGEGITVTDFTVESPSRILAKIDVAEDAALGPHEFRFENRDGAVSTGHFTLVPGGRAVVRSLTPAHAHAGETVDIEIRGFAFIDPVEVSLGDGITVDSVEFDSELVVRISASIAMDADAGPRALTVLNGPGLVTTAEGAFTVLPPRSLDVTTTSGRARFAPNVAGNRFSVRGTLEFNEQSSDGLFDPVFESAEVRIGDPSLPFVVEIAPRTGWKVKGPRASWRTRKGEGAPRVRLSLDLGKHRFRLDVDQAGIVIPESGEVVVEFALGKDTGLAIRTWTAVGDGFALK